MKHNFWNQNWTVRKTDSNQPPLPITLPYDAMIHESRDPNCASSYNTGYYPGGAYLYKKRFTLSQAERSRQHILEFEGIYQNSRVELNGRLLGSHHYGYTNFYVTLDSALSYEQENVLTVTADNSQVPNSRWYSGSGIYRPVILHTAPKENFIALNGIKITTKALSGQSACIHISVHSSCRAVHGKLTITILDSKNQVVAVGSRSDQDLYIPAPHPWSDTDPYRYTCLVELKDGDTLLDSDSVLFGIRTISIDAGQGLLLNGKRTFLNGGCVHHDSGVLGAATYLEAERRRVRILKEMGFNAIRSSHNPISKELLEACDESGMLVMDEGFDMWFSRKTKYDYSRYFREDWKSEVTALIEKDFNHPSVILYSIGNEIADTASPRSIEMARQIHYLIKQMDPTRFTTDCVNFVTSTFVPTTEASIEEVDPIETAAGANTILEKAEGNNLLVSLDHRVPVLMRDPALLARIRETLAQVDVIGYNYAKELPEFQHDQLPDAVFIASETYPDEILYNYSSYLRHPYLLGDFVWTAWDYIGEASIGDWNYGDLEQGLYKPYPALTAGCGLIDITGQPTQQAYFRQVVLGKTTIPYICVEDPSLSEQQKLKTIWRQYDGTESWSWDGCEGKMAAIHVFSNAQTVQLEQRRSDGTVQTQTADVHNFSADFELTYEPGSLKTTAYDQKHRVIGIKEIHSASSETKLQVKADKSHLAANKEDLAFLDIRITDSIGIQKMLSDTDLTISVSGAGEFLGAGSRKSQSTEEYASGNFKTWHGHAVAVIRSGAEPGPVHIQIHSDSLGDVSLELMCE